LIFNKYRIKNLIYSSKFSDVYEGFNEKEKEEVAIKFEKRSNFPLLESEALYLFNLQGFGIPKFITYGKNKNYNILIEELLGPPLLILWNSENNIKERRLKAICMLALQIIDRLEFIHSKNIIHRDIKLENILLHFDNPQDKENLNMMKARVKIIDFGFARKIGKNELAITTIGNPINMSPLLLKKLTSEGKARQLGYNQKADIWSLGSICYQMLIGKCAFDAEGMDDLVNKIEEGKYKVPTSLSTEVVSFLNGMLQYEPKERLTCEELYNHQFLRSNIKDFHKLDLTQVSDKVKDGKLVMETKKDKNRTIWSVFNENDKLLKISPGRAANPPANSGPVPIKHQNTSEPGNNNNININNNPAIKSANTFQMYSHPNINNYIYSQQNYNNPYSGPILPRGNQAIPGMQIYQNPAYYSNPRPNSNVPNYSNPSNYSSPHMAEVDYSFRGGIYGNLGK